MKAKLLKGLLILLACAAGTALTLHNAPKLKSQWDRMSKERWVRQQLDKRISYDFVDCPLEDVVSFFTSLTGVTFVLDPLEPHRNTPVTLKVNDLRVETALELIFHQANHSYRIADEVVLVTANEPIPRIDIWTYELSGVHYSGRFEEQDKSSLVLLLNAELAKGKPNPNGRLKIIGGILVLYDLGKDARRLDYLLKTMKIHPLHRPPPEVLKDLETRITD